MTREDRGPYDTRTTRSSRQSDTEPTDRLGAGRAAGADPVNPDWRGSRATRKNHRTQGLPSSRQEFVLWLQYGGWRVVVAAVALLLLLLVMIYISRSPQRVPQFSQPTEVAQIPAVGAGVSSLPDQPSAVSGSISPTAAAPSALGAAKFRVINTDDQGLFLRPDHNTDQPPLKTLTDGSVVTIVGQDFSGPDRVWKHVRDDTGAEGWVAADFLQAVP